jgi:hypothetical protein
MSMQSPSRQHLLPHFSWQMKAGFWACILIGIAVVFRRAFALQHPVATVGLPEVLRLDAFFQTHAALTRVHIFTAFLYVCLLPFVFWHRTRDARIVRIFFYTLGLGVNLSAFAMSTHPVGGAVESAATLFFNSLFLISLCASFQAQRTGETTNSLRWTLRATAVSLGIATTRPVMGIFFATSRLTHWPPSAFFGPAFWIGFSINTILMELWLRKHPLSPEGV